MARASLFLTKNYLAAWKKAKETTPRLL